MPISTYATSFGSSYLFHFPLNRDLSHMLHVDLYIDLDLEERVSEILL